MRKNISVRKRLTRIFQDDLGLDEPAGDVDLFNNGILDSLAFVDMLFRIEREFDITLSLDTIEFEKFQTMDSIVEFIDGRVTEVTQTQSHVNVQSIHR
ncbi:MAG: acyl carrier protein [Gammaproteobacteria bacterium]